jgi:hypothetical protein
MATPKFSDIQNILDAIAALNGQLSSSPHGAFWRQQGDYAQQYKLFTTGPVPGVPGAQIMNQQAPLQSDFYQMLITSQMPMGGPYITDANQTWDVNGTTMNGQQIQTALQDWLNNGYPQ